MKTTTRFKAASPAQGLLLLLILADHLDTVDPERFDMRRWWCGTTGCALGHAATMPIFQALGLRLSMRSDGQTACVRLGGVGGEGGTVGLGAARALFGLGYPDAAALFSPCDLDEEGDGGHRRTPREVAEDIRLFCRTSGLRGAGTQVDEAVRALFRAIGVSQ